MRGMLAVCITAMTLSSHVTSAVTSSIDSARSLSYRLPIVNVVYDIFNVKTDKDTHALRTY